MNSPNSQVEGLIIKGVGGEYTVVCGEAVLTCKARGVFRNRDITPFVGDYVVVDTQKHLIDSIKPRKNILRRPPVANIDQVIVTMAAASPAFNPGLLDRFLVLAERAGIDAVIGINKYDLHINEDFLEPYTLAGYPVVKVSAATGAGLSELRAIMEGKLNVFAGPSGVGKSSLINTIVPGASMEIGDISAKLRRGKHTTRHAEILPLGDGFCVDTPGFSSLEVDSIPVSEFDSLFLEFAPFLGLCKFSNCMHDKENDCAIKEQVGTAIHPARYESYLGFIRNEPNWSGDGGSRVIRRRK